MNSGLHVMKIKPAKINLTRMIRDLWVILVSMLFFMPANYAVPGAVYSLWQLMVCAVSMFYLFEYIRHNRGTLLWAVSCAFFSYYCVLSSLIVSHDIMTAAVFTMIKCIGFCSFFEFEVRKDSNHFIKLFIIGAVIMCSVHYATFIKYHGVVGGMNPVISYEGKLSAQHWFFFTHSNGSVFYFLPVLGIIWYAFFEISPKYKLLAYLFTIAVLVMYALEGSITALLTIALLFIFCIVVQNGLFRKMIETILSYKFVCIVGCSFCALMIIVNIMGSFTGVFRYFGKTNEDARSTFWINALEYFVKYPIFGVGYEDTLVSVRHIGKNHCHNLMIQLLYTSGLVGAILYTAMMVLAAPRNKKEKKNGDYVVIVAFLLFWVASTFDWYIYMPVQYSLFFMLKNNKARRFGIIKQVKDRIDRSVC